jgi:hypothetical protein
MCRNLYVPQALQKDYDSSVFDNKIPNQSLQWKFCENQKKNTVRVTHNLASLSLIANLSLDISCFERDHGIENISWAPGIKLETA